MKLDGLLNKVEEYLPSAPLDVVRRAYEFSAEKHKNQRRASGEPYVTHPLEVANIIADLRLDVPSIATGLLHDTVEDTLTTLENIEAGFGPEVASLVDGKLHAENCRCPCGGRPPNTLPDNVIRAASILQGARHSFG